MKELFELIAAEGEAGLISLVDQKATETVTLEFKRKSDFKNGQFSRDDKKNFGAMLSGFANSAGGLCVWGVIAEKGDEQIDCARELEPINNIERFTSEAQTLCGQLLIPRHDGVELRTIQSTMFPGRGYLLVKVDRSERRPHRCEASGQRQYFKRAGDSFFEMEHYDIEDAFNRKSSPALEVNLDAINANRKADRQKLELSIRFQILLENIGDVVCQYPYLEAKLSDNIGLIEPVALKRYGVVRGWQKLQGGADIVIHPGQLFMVAQLQAHHVNMDWQTLEFNILCEFRFGGLGMRRQERRIELPQVEILKYFRNLLGPD